MIKFSQTHEWVKSEDQIATVGISHFAQKELGEIVYVELPSVGHAIRSGDLGAVLESTKAAVDIYSPISGTIIEVNKTLSVHPENINSAAETEGWLFKVRMQDSKELDQLMSEKEYRTLLQR